VKTVFLFICCKGDLCASHGVHSRTRNSGLHFKVWKFQGRSFNGKDHEAQEWIAGNEVGGSGTEVLLKQVRKTSLTNDTVQLLLSGLRTGPCGLPSPLNRAFYKYVLKMYAVIKTNRVSMYLKTCPASAKILFTLKE